MANRVSRLIPLKVVETKKQGADGKPLVVDYKEQLVGLLGNSGGRGLNIKSMRTRLKLLDKVETAVDTLILTENEYQTLLGLVLDFGGWMIIDPAIDEFVQAIEDAERSQEDKQYVKQSS